MVLTWPGLAKPVAPASSGDEQGALAEYWEPAAPGHLALVGSHKISGSAPPVRCDHRVMSQAPAPDRASCCWCCVSRSALTWPRSCPSMAASLPARSRPRAGTARSTCSRSAGRRWPVRRQAARTGDQAATARLSGGTAAGFRAGDRPNLPAAGTAAQRRPKTGPGPGLADSRAAPTERRPGRPRGRRELSGLIAATLTVRGDG